MGAYCQGSELSGAQQGTRLALPMLTFPLNTIKQFNRVHLGLNWLYNPSINQAATHPALQGTPRGCTKRKVFISLFLSMDLRESTREKL